MPKKKSEVERMRRRDEAIAKVIEQDNDRLFRENKDLRAVNERLATENTALHAEVLRTAHQPSNSE